MGLESTASLTANVLLIVVLKLCDRADKIDVQDGDISWSLSEGRLGKLFSQNSLQLGPFALVHTLNFTLLFVTFGTLFRRFPDSWWSAFGSVNDLVVFSEDYLGYIVSMAILWFVWLILPILEIKEYHTVEPKNGTVPTSLSAHVSGVLSSTFALVLVGLLLQQFSSKMDTSSKFVFAGLSFSSLFAIFLAFGLAYKGIDRFLCSLAEELER